MADKIEQARSAAIRRLARDLRVAPSEAERWCVAWELFARRYGVLKALISGTPGGDGSTPNVLPARGTFIAIRELNQRR